MNLLMGPQPSSFMGDRANLHGQRRSWIDDMLYMEGEDMNIACRSLWDKSVNSGPDKDAEEKAGVPTEASISSQS